MATLSMTAVSTTLLGLQAYGYGEYAVPFMAGIVLAGIGFAYGYAEYGVWNQKNRDHSDMGNNFAVPRDVIDDTLIAAGVFAAVHGRQPDEEEMETIRKSILGPWEGFRDGIDLEDDQERERAEVSADD